MDGAAAVPGPTRDVKSVMIENEHEPRRQFRALRNAMRKPGTKTFVARGSEAAAGKTILMRGHAARISQKLAAGGTSSGAVATAMCRSGRGAWQFFPPVTKWLLIDENAWPVSNSKQQ